MPATLVVAYPKGSNVNMDYYLTQHLPATLADLEKAGMTGRRVTMATPLPGLDSPYEVMVFHEFPGVENVAVLLQSRSKEQWKALADDEKNFTQLSPVVWVMDESKA